MMGGEERNIDDFFAPPRKIAPQNVVNRLIKRETYGSIKPGTHFHVAREFYQNVFPSFTIINVETPHCYLRKFSPDGKHFVAVSYDQTCLEIYTYCGAAAAADLVRGCSGEYVGNQNTPENDLIRSQAFSRFFKLKCVVSVAESYGEQLNRECSLFTDDGRYIIIGSAATIAEDHWPNFYEMYSNNESVRPSHRNAVEDYCLYIVDLQQGRLCDSKHFKVDKIVLSHNQGLYLYRDTLAVLSIQHQSIHIFKITEDGTFTSIHTIGRFCYDDDDYILSLAHSGQSSVNIHRPFRDTTINSLKHRLMVYMFKAAKRNTEKWRNPYWLRKFYQFFDQYLKLRMWKMQLLDEDHLLVKYSSEDVVSLLKPTNEANTQISFFVFYNIPNAEILAVYDNTSDDLLKLFENFCDQFRNTKLNSECQFTCSPSNNIYARLIQRRFKQTIVSARFGGPKEATKRLLAQLPISAQSYSCSPYLDLALFSYDDKWVSGMERPKTCGEHPIRFYARGSGLLKFRIYAGFFGKTPPSSHRQLVAFTFHPTDPFAISVQRNNSDYIVNFHVRNA